MRGMETMLKRVYSHKAIDEACTDNHYEHRLQCRLRIPSLSIPHLDVEVSKSDNVLRYVMSPRTIACSGPQGAAVAWTSS